MSVETLPPLPLDSLRDGDPEALFQRLGTGEVRLVQRRVRTEMERKKEELRLMVGERYRDLIDAADTIRDMRTSSDRLLEAVRDMETSCRGRTDRRTDWRPGDRVEPPPPPPPVLQRFYSVSSQVRLLLEVPERVWLCLDSGRFLEASQLFLLLLHLHRLLGLHPPPPPHPPHHQPSPPPASGGRCSPGPVLQRFPILVRQLASTTHFRSTILVDSRCLLRGRAVSDQSIAEALVSIMLLEDSSPRQALADFLLARKASIHQLLDQSNHGSGIKVQVCSLVELLLTTLFQAYAVFYLPPEGGARAGEGPLCCGLLFSVLDTVTVTSSSSSSSSTSSTSSTTPAPSRTLLLDDSTTGSWSAFLPDSVTHFKPRLRTLAQPIQREQLRDTLQHWIDTCKEELCRGVSSLLVYVKSLKALASIRDAVWDLLSSPSISQHWTTVCQQLLERPLLVWEDFLQQLFLQRLQAITREETELISQSCVQLLDSALMELQNPNTSSSTSSSYKYELDVSSFLWSESPGDLPSDAAWVSVGQRGQQQRSGLAMKTQAFTPNVQNFCSSLDARLGSRLEDLQHYLPRQTGSDPSPTSSSSSSSSSWSADSSAVEEALRKGSVSCVRSILSSVRRHLSPSPSEPRHLSPSPSEPGSAPLSSALFLARLCHSIGQLCPNLKQCVLGRQGSADQVRAPPPTAKKLSRTKMAAPEVCPAQAQWAELQEELLSCSMEAYRIWSSAFSQVLLERLGAELLSQSAGSLLATGTNWEELEIQEEAESGSSVTSSIRLPVQPSWCVQSLLFQVCVEVNRVGGHSLPRATLQDLLTSCWTRTLDHYSTLMDSSLSLTQSRALQLLFDLKFLHSTLGGSRLEETRTARTNQDARFQLVSDWLERFIDPFDLDVFTPPISSNLQRLTSRTSVLLGLLSGSEKLFIPRSNNANVQENYNILPLVSSQTRFGLLPLNTSSGGKSRKSGTSCDGHLTSSQPSSSSSSSEVRGRPGSFFRQLADQNEDAATPSLFKLSWLSGIK